MSVLPPGGRPFFSFLAQVLDEHLSSWGLTLRTLPDDQLRTEYEALAAMASDFEPVPANLLLDLYGAEIRRRSASQ